MYIILHLCQYIGVNITQYIFKMYFFFNDKAEFCDMILLK